MEESIKKLTILVFVMAFLQILTLIFMLLGSHIKGLTSKASFECPFLNAAYNSALSSGNLSLRNWAVEGAQRSGCIFESN